MRQTHPLAKLQFLFAVLMLISFCIFPNNNESSQITGLLVMNLPFLGLSLVTIYLGWLMVVKKENIIYPYETFAARIVETFNSKQAAESLLSEYSKPNRQKVIGLLNILSGFFCFLLAVIIIVGFFRDL